MFVSVLICRYELGSEEDDMDAVRRKATALTPRFHVMLVSLAPTLFQSDLLKPVHATLPHHRPLIAR